MQVFQGAGGVNIGSATFNNLTNGNQTNHHYGDSKYISDSYNTERTHNYNSNNHTYSNVGRKQFFKNDKRKTANTANLNVNESAWGQRSNEESNWNQEGNSGRPDAGANPWIHPPRSAPPRTQTITGYPYNETQSAEGYLPRGHYPEDAEEGEGDEYAPPAGHHQRRRERNWEDNTDRYQQQNDWNANPSNPMYMPRPQRGNPEFLDPNANMPNMARPSYYNPSSYHPHRTPSASDSTTRRDSSRSPSAGGPYLANNYNPYQSTHRGQSSSPNQAPYHPQQQPSPPQSGGRWSPSSSPSTQQAQAQAPPPLSQSPQQSPPAQSKNPFSPYYKRNVDSASAPPSSTANTTPPPDSMAVDG